MCAAAILRPQDDTTIRVNTRLVEVEVVVHRDGRPVGDLEAEDFSLFDQGKRQPIAEFFVRRDSESTLGNSRSTVRPPTAFWEEASRSLRRPPSSCWTR